MNAEAKKILTTALTDVDLFTISTLITTGELDINEIESVLTIILDHGYYLGERAMCLELKNYADDLLPRLKARRFTPPTPEEVTKYAASRGYRVDGAAFVDHYKSKGWKDSNGRSVRDWKGKVRSVWCRPENKLDQENYLQVKTH